MRNIALAAVFCTVFAASAARANDFATSDDKIITSTSPVKDDGITATSPVKEEESVAPSPFVRLPRPNSGSLAGATVLRSLHVGLAVSQAYDIYSTTHALRRGAVEVNPLLKDTVTSRAAFIGLKVAMTAGPIYEAEKLWRSHHRFAAVALMAASNGIMMAVAAHNASVMNNAVSVR